MNFKRILIALAAVCIGFGINAQTSGADTYEFNRHFYLNVQGGVGYTVGETSFGHLITPAAAFNLGYNFSPVFGVRIGGSGWQAKGSWSRPRDYYKYKYLQGNLDLVVNLTNAICGWQPQRLFNGYLFIGGAFNHSFDNDGAIALAAAGRRFSYLWNPVRNFGVGRAGLGANFRLSDHVAINLEVNVNGLSDHFNSKYGGNIDWQFNGLAGLTFTLGKSYKVIPAPVVEQPVPEAKPEPVKEEPAPAPAPKPEPVKEQPAPKVAPFECNVFFNINSYSVSKAEAQKVDNLASYLKEHKDAKVQITGYADKATGTAAVNQRISERRAAAVAAALAERGIDSSRISTSAKGDTVQPFSVNDENRVSICVAEP
jgi:outer membrane protein OmpA-like peptidoglycan-associated protein